METLIDTEGCWTSAIVDLTRQAGTTCALRVEIHANDWTHEAAYVHRIVVEP